MHLLELKNLSYLVKGKRILSKLNLTVEQNDFLTIVGPSGAGKSTLLKLIASLLTPTAGQIYYQDKNIAEYSPLAYRRQVSYCFQQPSLFGKTVKDNLLFPYQIRKKEVDQAHLLSLLQKVQLDATFLNKEITALSGGEKQRVALIRNLVFLPQVLLLDEVTTGLDAQNKEIVHHLFQEVYQNGVTILQVTHDQAEIAQANKIFTVKKEASKWKTSLSAIGPWYLPLP